MASRRRKVCKLLVPAKPTGLKLSMPLFISWFLLVMNSRNGRKFCGPCYANDVIKLACRYWLQRFTKVINVVVNVRFWNNFLVECVTLRVLILSLISLSQIRIEDNTMKACLKCLRSTFDGESQVRLIANTTHGKITGIQ